MEDKEIPSGMEFARNDDDKQEFGVMQYDNEKKFQKVIWGSKELRSRSSMEIYDQHEYNNGQIGYWEVENLDKLEEEYKIKSNIVRYLKEELRILVTKPEQYVYSLLLIKAYYYLLGDVDKAKEYSGVPVFRVMKDNKDLVEFPDFDIVRDRVDSAISRAALGDLTAASNFLRGARIPLKREYNVSQEGFEEIEKHLNERYNGR